MSFTVIDFSVSLSSIHKSGLPDALRERMARCESFMVSGHGEVLGHIGRRCVLSMTGRWDDVLDGKLFIPDEHGWGYHDESEWVYGSREHGVVHSTPEKLVAFRKKHERKPWGSS